MNRLPSGLPELVADEETLARFLTSSGQFAASKGIVKGAAFLPKNFETSVFRHGREPSEDLWALGRTAVQDRALYGAGFVSAASVRDAGLEARADEGPPRHANLIGWPAMPADPELEKSKHKDMANVIAGKARLELMPEPGGTVSTD